MSRSPESELHFILQLKKTDDMKKKLKCVLLIDDNEADNFFHKTIITQMDIAENIEVAWDGVQALEFLKKENQIIPELIFLDINMPKVNGWEFLEAYKNLKQEQKTKIIIIMLTTSLNPNDEEKARKISEVKGFKNKPISKQMMTEIMEMHFADFR